ncbi:hypothetical protein VFPPC_17675 [Pochonia chlamydosporia 170]|uniref:Uncharacterized protein n=1 Tax=Pochonia chlamydosporia 170 TaxID=1380566 RepID=A0A219ARB7_METCM|nr:hypothetical protein VFPPC_17675 [Pochonia chlamydosporia 170]OWT43149.1 hypothetical protein VFPPC_17675 [Pochonia chlamydosporia 170]
MKTTLALLSLLPIFGAATAIGRSEPAEMLPVIDGDNSGHTKDPRESKPLAASERSASAAQLCPPGYPFLCNGYCCPYNRCCARQCCGSRATFCGADGLCYY